MSISANLGSVEVNGITYVPADSVGISSTPVGNRAVVVIDRGWIFAGNVTTCEVTGELTISNAVHVFRWESIGFTGVLQDPTSNKVTLKKCDYPVKVPSGSVIFTVPVTESWGK